MLNNNFKELVRKYETYRSKRIRRIVLAVVGLVALLIAGFYAVFNSKFIVKSFQKTTPESNITKEITPTTKAIVTATKEIQEIVPKRVAVDTPKDKVLPALIYKRNTKNISNKSQFKLEVHERKNLYKLLTDHKEQDNYQSAIEVAKFYFKEKNYDRVVTWSVKASKKEPKQSLPWILYAKSKVSQGKTNVAEKALTIYLKHTKSKEVQDLLNSLK